MKLVSNWRQQSRALRLAMRAARRSCDLVARDVYNAVGHLRRADDAVFKFVAWLYLISCIPIYLLSTWPVDGFGMHIKLYCFLYT